MNPRSAAQLALIAAVAATSATAQDFVYERLWPALQHPWYFVETRSVAVDGDDNIFVVDSFNHRIHRYSREGQLTSRFGQEGVEPGQFTFPIAVATDAAGNLYVAETDTIDFRRVQKLDPTGAPILQFGQFGSGPGGFGVGVPEDNGFSPFDVEIDAEGNVWVSGSNRLQRFDPAGNFLQAIPPFGQASNPFELLTGFDVAPDGTVFALDGATSEVLVFDPAGSLQRRFGEPGHEAGQIFIGNDVEIDASGRVYVADGGNGKIIRFEADGDDFIEWGEPGTEPGQFQFVWRLDFDSEGLVYTVETGDDDFGMHRVQKFTSDGQFLQEWGSASTRPGRFIQPDGVAVDSNGRVIVADAGNDRVQAFSSEGAFLFEFGGNGTGPGDLTEPAKVAIGPAGDIYVMEFEGGRVQRFAADGSFDGAVSPSFDLPGALAIDGAGNVYVTEIGTDTIHKLNADLEPLLQWGGHTECFEEFTGAPQACSDGVFNEPRSITIDRSGSADQVVVGDYFNRRLQRFDTSGGFLSRVDIEFFPTAIRADAAGNIFLLPFSNSRGSDGHFFTLLDDTGQPLGFWGEFGSNPGQLNTPTDLALAPDGRVYLADALNHRIVAFAPSSAIGNTKAVIVAGGGPFQGNTLWPATQLNANFAYRALTQQGYTNASIQYLSADTRIDLDGNGVADDVDAQATVANLEDAITEWAADARDVVIYLVDHGGADTFRMGGNELLAAAELGAWIETLQSRIDGRITLVYDACQSGSFADELSNGAEDRVVIASAAQNQSAFFVDGGSLSFSRHFWTQVFNGASVGDAYRTARDITLAAFPTQTPLLDANGDGTSETAADFAVVDASFIGNGSPDNGERPVIGSVSPPQAVSGANQATLFADGVADDDGIARVWAVIRAPGDPLPRDPSDPVQELPRQELAFTGASRRHWEGVITGLNVPGTYTISINAADAIGNRAIPRITTVNVQAPAGRRAIVLDTLVNAGSSKGAAEAINPALPALMAQGYGDDDITYLAAGNSAMIDGAAGKSALASALQGLSGTSTRDLLLALVGRKNEMGQLATADGGLSAAELDTMLDAVQVSISGTLVVVYDGDDAGTYVPVLAPEPNQRRVVIASAQAQQDALYEFDGQLGFSQAFWEAVELGANLNEAFDAGRQSLAASLSPQVPVLEDNANGIGNDGLDGQLTGGYSLGSGIVVAGDPPLIGTITPDQTLDGQASGSVEISNVTTTGTVARATALIFPPGGFNGAAGFGKSELRTMVPVGPDRYRLDFEGFTRRGAYQVAAYALDDQGQLSPPAVTRVVQTSGAAVPGFQVTAGISGAWFDPTHNGEGWLIQVLDDQTALIYWFTYGPNGEGSSRQVWIGAQTGRIEGPNIIIEQMITTAGPTFGDGFDPADLRTDGWGDVTFHFDDCNSGRMYYRGRDNYQQGLLDLTRITSLADNPCDAAATHAVPKGAVIDGRMSGAWFDPSHAGEGWLLEILPDNRALSVWFTYDELGRQQWLIGTGEISGNTIDFPQMQRPIGAFFGPAFDPDGVDRADWGRMTFTFSDCNAGNMTYQANDPQVGSGSLLLTPLTKIQGLGCD